MIPRYSRPEMAKIWELENKFNIWLEIEMLAAEKMEELGLIPAGAGKNIRAKANFNVDRIHQIEKEVKHDVIAFLTSVAEHVGDDSRFIHQGMTSSDIIDTAFGVQLQQSADIIIKELDGLINALKQRAQEHKMTLCIGRSHGIHAEPTTFGLKLAGHYAAFKRAKERLIHARDEISICAMSGAVGTFATLDPRIEEYVAEKLGLQTETVSTQIIPRDRHAMFFATLGVVASSIENFATEIRHLQRTEVREVEEFFSEKQKGSSAMPHKRNPILSENLTGLARNIRASVVPALENVTLWHERDISHSSTERMIAPNSCITLDFALHRLTGVVKNLVIYPERMKKNMESMGGLVFSQRTLLALTSAGISREDAYRIVQRNAMKVWNNDAERSLKSYLKDDEIVMSKIDRAQLDSIFDYNFYTKNIDYLFERTFG
mgnify:FL=1|jgi:adenylosuccinate lyase|tara:strand:- start:385232 stop:386530 length:1299 start_codon:yes stop_codon:yes gene_type:complete